MPCAGQGGSLSGRLAYAHSPKVTTAKIAVTTIPEINFMPVSLPVVLSHQRLDLAGHEACDRSRESERGRWQNHDRREPRRILRCHAPARTADRHGPAGKRYDRQRDRQARDRLWVL